MYRNWLCGHFTTVSAESCHLEYGRDVSRRQTSKDTNNACAIQVGLLMHYALDLPEAGGLGVRRLQWVCSRINYPSLKVSERMGFRCEGILRWSKVLPPKKVIGYKAAPERNGDPWAGSGARDSVISSCCWDDWEGGVREWVDKVMARTK